MNSHPPAIAHSPGAAVTADPAKGARAIIRTVASDIKLAHSVFALPFAILGAFLAWRGEWPSVGGFLAQLALIIPCMVLARTWAMLFNRLADRRFDAENPRTAGRALASGRLSPAQAWCAALLAAVLFIAATGAFYLLWRNPWPLFLSIPTLAWIAFYSLTKRFTALCHIFLGGALAASPIAAAIAVNPSQILAWPVPALSVVLLAGMVLCWVAGFDIIYALQDIDFDRRRGLASIPARVGWQAGLWISRGLHVLSLCFLIAAWLAHGQLGWIFGAGVGAVAALLISEHAILIRRGRSGLDLAFFTLNGVVSVVLGVAGCLDVVV